MAAEAPNIAFFWASAGVSGVGTLNCSGGRFEPVLVAVRLDLILGFLVVILTVLITVVVESSEIWVLLVNESRSTTLGISMIGVIISKVVVTIGKVEVARYSVLVVVFMVEVVIISVTGLPIELRVANFGTLINSESQVLPCTPGRDRKSVV